MMTTITKCLCERYIWQKLQDYKMALLQIEQGQIVDEAGNDTALLLKNTIKVHEDALEELREVNKDE